MNLTQKKLGFSAQVRLVANIPSDYVFISDSQDVRAVKEMAPAGAMDYDSFFVKIGEGEYVEIWGMHGIIPELRKTAYRVL